MFVNYIVNHDKKWDFLMIAVNSPIKTIYMEIFIMNIKERENWIIIV